MHFCDVIIVNYNAGALLDEAVASARHAGAAHVVVVDNASADDSLAAVEARADPCITIVRNAANLGFAAACNAGVKASRNDTVLFLNPDARLGPDSLARLTQVLWSNERIGMVGPKLVNPDGTEQRGGRRRLPTLGSGFGASIRSLAGRRLGRSLGRLAKQNTADFNQNEEPLPAHPVDVEAISGGCMMIRRSAIETVGLWDERYFLHVEDLDYCMRFALHHLRIVFVPDTTVVHVKGASSGGRAIFVEWHKHKGMMIFYDKYLSGSQALPVRMLVKTGILARFCAVALSVTAQRMKRRIIRNPAAQA